MSRTKLRDLYGTATITNGLPTVTFKPEPYRRIIEKIVVTNGASSTVNVYRAQLGSVPVATNPLGSNNTLTDPIDIPAGQGFFVQWSVAGSPVSSGVARVSLSKEDDPFRVTRG